MKLVSTFILLLVAISSGHACSIFKYTVNGRTYFCGNEDWTARDPAIQTVEPNAGEYGYVLFGWKSFLPRYVQAGVNSEGLCFDWAVVPPQKFVRQSGRKDLTLDFTTEVLKKCASVDEAIAYIRQYNIPHLSEEHIMFADRTGKSCVVEYNNSRVRLVVNQAEYQFMTNFHLTNQELGWYPCDRYAKMEAFFKEAGNKEARLIELLDSLHQEGQYPTVYSYVFDLSRMEITVFYNHNYRVRQVYSVDSLISEGRSLSISSLRGKDRKKRS